MPLCVGINKAKEKNCKNKSIHILEAVCFIPTGTYTSIAGHGLRTTQLRTHYILHQ